MTTWPASVAVTVELSPQASNATANSCADKGEPSMGAIRL